MRQVAAFDFDGTLTTRDTFAPYLRLVAGIPAFAVAVAATAPLLVAAAVFDGRRDPAKAAFLRRILAGREEAALRDLGARYADSVVADHLRVDMRARLESHRRDGHELVIVSASPTLYLDAVGERLGVDTVLATELEVAADGRLTGEIAGANVRRAEKVRRLDAWLDGPAEIWAYGDSTGDRELLARADHSMKV